jgi:hypothetical protein
LALLWQADLLEEPISESFVEFPINYAFEPQHFLCTFYDNDRLFSISLENADVGCPTVCVTRAGAGVDNVWEQEKPEARKMPENAAECPCPVRALLGGF